jgi:hypothetical protein
VRPDAPPALGAVYVAAYSARDGAATSARTGGPALTPERAGEAIAGLVTGPAPDQDAYLLTAAGLRPLPRRQARLVRR